MENQQNRHLRILTENWICKIAAAAGVELTEATATVYLERLLQLPVDQIEAAGRRTIDEWDKPHMMPPLAFVLERAGTNKQLDAEQAWELAWKLVKRDWYADGIGWAAGVKAKMTPAMEYAIRQCGGEYRMAYEVDGTNFPFVRKEFIAAHERFALEDGGQVRLTQGEARKALALIGNVSFTNAGRFSRLKLGG